MDIDAVLKVGINQYQQGQLNADCLQSYCCGVLNAFIVIGTDKQLLIDTLSKYDNVPSIADLIKVASNAPKQSNNAPKPKQSLIDYPQANSTLKNVRQKVFIDSDLGNFRFSFEGENYWLHTTMHYFEGYPSVFSNGVVSEFTLPKGWDIDERRFCILDCNGRVLEPNEQLALLSNALDCFQHGRILRGTDAIPEHKPKQSNPDNASQPKLRYFASLAKCSKTNSTIKHSHDGIYISSDLGNYEFKHEGKTYWFYSVFSHADGYHRLYAEKGLFNSLTPPDDWDVDTRRFCICDKNGRVLESKEQIALLPFALKSKQMNGG